ncbi:recombinase family protein [Agrobacterium vitis]|uniref:recombinase family protein n=1 Tax=Allorhizobium ampelinum TaxID=3025782 RepID=UPI001F213D8C|nr:recombinase family protein [Allorhizobium ampelinum]MCF1459711.1 recombinase family protein [Allorhizobium ampelinum]
MRSPTVEPRAFIYARTATVSQLKPDTRVEQQLKTLRAYAQRRSYLVVGEVCDAGIHGNTLSRLGLAIVMDAATSAPRAFDVLLVDECTRLARDTVLLQTLVSRLRAGSVEIEFTSSGLSPYPEEKPMENFLAALCRHLGVQDDRD